MLGKSIDAMNLLTGKEVTGKRLECSVTTSGAAFNLPIGQAAGR